MQPENLDKSTEPETSDDDSKGILDLLNSDDSTEETEENAEDTDSESDDKSTTGEDESGDGDEDSDEEEVEEEEEIEEVKEEDEQETATFRKLREKFPNIFKEFPGLRNQLGREKAFSEVFSTVEEAREAEQKVRVFDYFDQQLTVGDPTTLVQALPSKEQALRFAEGILPALRNASPELFSKAIDPVFRNALHKIAKDAENAGDKNLRASVSHISRYLYGKPDLPELPKRTQEQDPEKELLKRQLDQSQSREYDRYQNSVDKAIINQATKEAKSYFDPQNTLTPKAQEVWIDRIIQEVDEELQNNPTHMARMKAFREKALKSGLPDELRGRMLAAWLSTARPVLKTISQRIKREMLGKNGSNPEQKRSEGKKVIPSSSGKTPGGTPNPKATKISWKDVKQYKAKGGSMEDLLRS